MSSASEYKVVAIREANDLKEISLEVVFGKLRAYDLEVQQKKQSKEARAKPVALHAETDEEEEVAEIPHPKVEKKKKKALAAQTVESESSEEIDSDSAESETDVDELAVLLARALRGSKFRRFKSKAR